MEPPDLLERPAGRAGRLDARYRGASAARILEAAIGDVFPGEIAAVSSFGAESAVLLHMIADIDRSLPVLFVDTGRHFGETHRYRDLLRDRLRLDDVRVVAPERARTALHDPDGLLFNRSADRCCRLRKVEPLRRGLGPYRAWITGRKRFQGAARADLAVFEEADGRIKVNPLAGWRRDEIDAYRRRHELPEHPLVAQGFRSLGCMPCTTRTAPGEDPRAGRWRGSDKSECGIHLPGFEQDGSGI